jgi:hypothetical protein
MDALFAGAAAVLVKQSWYVYTMRVGAVSGERSAGSRSISSPAQIALVAAEMASRYSGVMSPRQRRLVEGLRNYSLQRCFSQELTARRRAGNAPSVVALAVRHPLKTVKYVRSSTTWKRLAGGARPAAS